MSTLSAMLPLMNVQFLDRLSIPFQSLILEINIVVIGDGINSDDLDRLKVVQ